MHIHSLTHAVLNREHLFRAPAKKNTSQYLSRRGFSSVTCCVPCCSLIDDGPILHRSVHKRTLLFSHLHGPYHDVQGVVGIVNHIAKGHQVPLAGREVYVLDPLVLKLLDSGEFGSLPECHTHFVHCGQVRAQRRPVEVSFSPALRTQAREGKGKWGRGRKRE